VCVNRSQICFVEFWNSKRFRVCRCNYSSRVVNDWNGVIGNSRVVNEENG
jgi:hypothetical protein